MPRNSADIVTIHDQTDLGCCIWLYLKDEIYVPPLVDRFYELDYLDIDDNEKILGQRIRRRSVDIFLRKLLRFREDGYERFLVYLRQSDQSHVADTLQENIFPSELPDINKTHAEIEASILMNIDALCDDLEPDKTADYFIVYREFTIDEYESIISHRNRRMKAEEMVGLILEHLPRGYQVLRQIYKEMGKTKMLKALDEVFVAENLDEINKNIRETFERKRRELHCMQYGSGHFNTKMKLNVSGSASPACEEELVKRIQEQIEEINIGLQKYTSCRIVLVKEGSIVIHLLSCGTLFRMEDETRKDVSKLLNRIFLHPVVDAFGSYDGRRFRVTVESNIQMRLDGKLKKESIERHKDYLSEELSAVPFLRHKKTRTIFKQSEIDSVFDCKPISREKRMQISF
ncbi:uncharacterized protein LOC123561123 [Mercenaria mercenaria]|uniref:uncharacterized protein LOC123561123 n=1 Tax=Mercenaria mercenaria TaxID=6596 RepID=UPI00234E9885|nr:uncharacterized protein LOC123561123 [Mercenaria mercenaria]